MALEEYPLRKVVIVRRIIIRKYFSWMEKLLEKLSMGRRMFMMGQVIYAHFMAPFGFLQTAFNKDKTLVLYITTPLEPNLKT